jgi:MFS family permease
LILAFTHVHPLIPYCLIGLSYSMVPNSIWPAISMVCGDENAGTAFGTVTAINSLELLVVPYVCGFLLDRFGSYNYVSYLLAASGVLGLILSILLHIVDSRKQRFLFFDKESKQDKKTEKTPLLINGSSGSITLEK